MRRLGPLLSLLLACGGAGPSVTRVVDGRPVEGRFVPPVAYELFLRGAIAEETGQSDLAIKAFAQAARIDGDDALVWTRLAQALCRKDPHDAMVQSAIDQALAIDPDFGPALALSTTCGNGDDDAARRAIRAEPVDVPLAVSMQRRFSSDDDARQRLTALALATPTPAAWAALYEWGDAHADDALSSWAALRLARSAAWTTKLSLHALALAGDGALVSARTLSGALVDGEGRVTDPLVARLAIDDALSRADRAATTRRASRCQVSLTEVAARALVLGDVTSAVALASLVVGADPDDVSARMVLAAAGERTQDLASVKRALAGAKSSPPEASASLVFARALARSGDQDQARAFVPHGLLGTDALLVPLAVELAARAGVDAPDLPEEARIELALRNDDRATLRSLTGGDRRHRLAALAWMSPKPATETKALALALGQRAPDDPLVRASILHLLAANEPSASAPTIAVALELLRLGPIDPIAVASSLDVLASTPSAAQDFTRAKARMALVAVTPHEHRLAQ